MASKKRSSKKVVKAPSSKMEGATKLYQDMTKRGLHRKAIIEAFMSDDCHATLGESCESVRTMWWSVELLSGNGVCDRGTHLGW
jgi:hypothetical protein